MLNVDETGHKQNGQRQWTWCFRAGLYTLFKIDPTRSADVLIEVLGAEFDGVLGCDYFSAYRRYHRECGVVLQFCLAHLIRDVKFLTTLPDARDRAYGERLARGVAGAVRGDPPARGTGGAGVPGPAGGGAGRGVAAAGRTTCRRRGPAATWRSGWSRTGRAISGSSRRPGVEPTNNLAEQAIRFVVIDRLITQGTRSERGDRWCERIWTVMATCSQQGRSVFAYLEAAVAAWFQGDEAPSLLPRES